MCISRRFRKGLKGDVMGGRGGSSGLSGGGKEYSVNNIKKKLPDMNDFKLDKPPQLEGSEKQIAWAKQIRAEFVPKLVQSVFAQQQDIVKAMNSGGKDGVAQHIHDEAVNTYKNRYSYISNKKEAEKLADKDIANYVNRSVSSYNTLKNRVQAVNKLASNNSAKFWIDNRNSYDEIRKKILGIK